MHCTYASIMLLLKNKKKTQLIWIVFCCRDCLIAQMLLSVPTWCTLYNDNKVNSVLFFSTFKELFCARE